MSEQVVEQRSPEDNTTSGADDRRQRLLEKMDRRKQKNSRPRFDDPFDEFLHFLTNDDLRLSPNVFVEYVALLVRYYSGRRGRFTFQQPITRIHAFDEGEYGIIALPGRKSDKSLCILTDQFEWIEHGGFNMAKEAQASATMVFLECGRQQVSANVTRPRHICIWAPTGGVLHPQKLRALNEQDHLLCFAQSQYGLGLDGDTRSPAIRRTVLIEREHINHNVLFLWKQERKIYAFVCFSKFVDPIIELYEINAIYDDDPSRPVEVVPRKVFEFHGIIDWGELTKLVGAYYDAVNQRFVGCTTRGQIIRILDDGTLFITNNLENIAAFGKLKTYDRYFGLFKDGSIVEIEVTLQPGHLTVHSLGEFLTTMGVKDIFYNFETEIVHVISAMMASASHRFTMTSFPILSHMF